MARSAGGAAVTVFSARRILTMNPSRPEASAVAVRAGRVLAVGELDEIRPWLVEGQYQTDRQFADRVLLPGLIEAHMHAQASGLVWEQTYVGYWDRPDPDGRVHAGLKTKAAVLDRLREAVARPGATRPLLARGFDPVFLDGAILTAEDLDAVGGDHPIYVVNASGHLAYANTAMFELAGVDATTTVEGVMRADGRLTGELREGGMEPFRRCLGEHTAERMHRATVNASRLAHRAGVTTMTEWSWGAVPNAIEGAQRAAADPNMKARFVGAPLRRFLQGGGSIEAAIEAYRRLKAAENEYLGVGPVKAFRDGSIQGFTALLRWPGYLTRDEPGMELDSVETLRAMLPIHAAGLQIAVHTNGDQATQDMIDTVQFWQDRAPRFGHRHILEHNQLASDAQFRRMAELGLVTNLFANHLYYWGDVHATRTVGPERAGRMDNAAAARRYGVPFALHSDDPVTPVNPLFTAWCAVNRTSHTGRVLGEDLRLSVDEALRAITLGAAYVLHRDHELGSIEVGKRADFTVLEDDPLAVPPAELKDIPIWGTVLGGRVQLIEGN